MAAITEAMWDATPDSTNSYWYNSGSDSGGKSGGVGSFVYTGGTAGLVAGYGIGSTLDFAGNFNSQYGHVTDGVLHYTYWTNGTPGSGNSIQGLNGHRMKLSQDTNWYGTGGRANWGFASAAASAEHLSGISRIGSNWKIYQATQTGRVFYGNQYVKTLGINKIGNIAGKASFGIGVAMDIRGMLIYKDNPSSPNAVHPAKAGLNTTMGAIGVWGGPPGAIASGFYFGIDAFYPGGWAGAINDQDRLYQENKAINPNWQMFPGAMKQ